MRTRTARDATVRRPKDRTRVVLPTVLVAALAWSAGCADEPDRSGEPDERPASTTALPADGTSSTGVTAPGDTGTTSDTTATSVTTTGEATTTPARSTPSTTSADHDEGGGTLQHPAGVEVRHPEGWVAAGAQIATEFGLAADCRSVRIVDREPPPDSGDAEGAQILQSIVQVCAQPTSASTVQEYVVATYGSTNGFERIEIGGTAAFRSGSSYEAAVVFTIHRQFAIQILTSVVADTTLESQRNQQVEGIVESIRLV